MPISAKYSTTLPVKSAVMLPKYKVMTPENDAQIIPFRIVMTAGALTSQLCTAAAFVTDQGSQILRLWHHAAPGNCVKVILSSNKTNALTVDTTNAGLGYTSITVGGASATVTIVGFLVITATKGGRILNGAIVDDASIRTLRGVGISTCRSPVPDMIMGWATVQLDGANAPIQNTAFGSTRFNVTSGGTGINQFNLEGRLPANAIVYAICSSTPVGAAVDPANLNRIVVTTGSGAATGACTITLVYFFPGSAAGAQLFNKVNNLVALNRASSKNAWPLWGLDRDAYLAAFELTTDAGGLLTSASKVPSGLVAKKNTTALEVLPGKGTAALLHATLLKNSNGTMYVASEAGLQQFGKMAFTLGGTEASQVFSGLIVGSHGAHQ